MDEQAIIKAIHEVDKKIDLLTEKVEGSFNTRLKVHEKRIQQLETNQRWVVIAVLGSVLTAILNLVLK